MTTLQEERRTDEVSRDDIFQILSNARRRRVLEYVEYGDDVTLIELVDVVAEAETGNGSEGYEDSPTNIRSSVYSALVQTHLPAMEEAGILEYDPEEQVIRTTGRTREAKLYLEYLPGNEIPWAEYYLGLTAVFAALLTVTWLTIPPFDLLTIVTVALLMVLVLLVSSIAHVIEIRRNRLDM